MGRPLTSDVPRPRCPRGDVGTIYLDGKNTSHNGRFERTRYRCVPAEARREPRVKGHYEGEHVFLGPLPARRESTGHSVGECPHCERVFARAEGLAGGSYFSFVLREVATALVRIGRGDPYRAISRDLRLAVGRLGAKGKRKGLLCRSGQLATDYLDVFGSDLVAAVSPDHWPRIVALDSKPIRVRDHSSCCPAVVGADGRRRRVRVDTWGPPADVIPISRRKHRRPKISHSTDNREIGQILVAVGYEHAGDIPRAWAIRFEGGGDQESWEEFLRSLPGTPEWIVSDRAGAIEGAVSAVWKGAPTHYFCEKHLTDNMTDAAREDGLDPRAGVLRAILEEAQYGLEEYAKADGAAAAFGAAHLSEWLATNKATVLGQIPKRRSFYPRSAGACESVIGQVERALGDRVPHFGNASRLNLLLGLVRADLDQDVSVAAYSKLLRARLTAGSGRSEADWWAIRDADGELSSIDVLLADVAARAKAARAKRQAPKKAAAYRKRRATIEAERQALGLPLAPRGRGRVPRIRPDSVAGTHVSDYGWLVAEWHPTQNGDRDPADVPAGSGELIWWHCSLGAGHDWRSQVRSRTLSGSGCPFCDHKRVSAAESLAITHPDVAAQWHPARNGTKTPADFTYGSHFEAWWQCSKFRSHVWRARISSRTSQVAGCSLCARLEGRGGQVRHDAEANAVA